MQYLIPLVSKFIADSVLNAAGNDLNGSQKLQLIGVLTIISMMQLKGEAPTSLLIAEHLDINRAIVHKNVAWLVSKGIVKRTKILNKTGKGQAFKLTLHETVELRKLLGLEDN